MGNYPYSNPALTTKNEKVRSPPFFPFHILYTSVQGLCYAADYYVSPSGSDSDTGSQASPFRTIDKAASVVTAGETGHVASGNNPGIIRTTADGIAANRIHYVSDIKWGAKLTLPSGTSTEFGRLLSLPGSANKAGNAFKGRKNCQT